MGRIITEADLRSRCLREGTDRFEVEADVFITESARTYLYKRDIRLVVLPTALGETAGSSFVDAATKLPINGKPEEMTHLRGNLLVPKTNLRILLRGKLDSLESEVLEAQAMAHSQGYAELRDSLGEVLEHLRLVLGAEVKEQPLEEKPLFGLSQGELRRISHSVQSEFGMASHPVPTWEMGPLALRINSIRAQVREAELAAVAAFSAEGEQPRHDLTRELNRLSSGVYILFCRLVAGSAAATKADFPVEASARHVHLTVAAVEALFGAGARLTPKRPLSQPGEFLCEQRVCLKTPKGEIAGVAVLGPEREAVQVELSLTDARMLGIKVLVNLSGDLHDGGDVLLKGDRGVFSAPGSVIAARAHLHMTTADAVRFGVKNGQKVGVRVNSQRSVTFEGVLVRVKDSYALAMHLDMDEANACCVDSGTRGSIIAAK